MTPMISDEKLNAMFRSMLEEDHCAVVVCDLTHTIVYMNPAAAAAQAKHGGYELVGKNLLNCHGPASQEKIKQVVDWFQESVEHNRVHTFFNPKQDKDGYMIALRDGDGSLLGYYEKHEYRIKDESPFYGELGQ